MIMPEEFPHRDHHSESSGLKLDLLFFRIPVCRFKKRLKPHRNYIKKVSMSSECRARNCKSGNTLN
jgi:hypothetical protein